MRHARKFLGVVRAFSLFFIQKTPGLRPGVIPGVFHVFSIHVFSNSAENAILKQTLCNALRNTIGNHVLAEKL